MKNTDIFHVHTYRCGHAGQYSDSEYIQVAISLGATSIAFTDHAPFPGDPFGNRMSINDLEEYIDSLKQLQQQYSDQIAVKIGLEIEYFPKYHAYYHELRNNLGIEMLMIGQHMYDLVDNDYSFSLNVSTLEEQEYLGLGRNIIAGIKTGLFPIIAHPDRIYRKRKMFGQCEYNMALEIVETAIQYDVLLEVNKSSVETGLYVPEFWDIAKQKGAKIVFGLDAHSPQEICLWSY